MNLILTICDLESRLFLAPYTPSQHLHTELTCKYSLAKASPTSAIRFIHFVSPAILVSYSYCCITHHRMSHVTAHAFRTIVNVKLYILLIYSYICE